MKCSSCRGAASSSWRSGTGGASSTLPGSRRSLRPAFRAPRRSSTSWWIGGWPKRRWRARLGLAGHRADPGECAGHAWATGRPDLAYADTNLFVALLVGSGHPLHEQALGVFRRVADGQLGLIVTPIVVAELVYVARSLLGWTRQLTAQRLGPLLEADGLVLTEGPVRPRPPALRER